MGRIIPLQGLAPGLLPEEASLARPEQFYQDSAATYRHIFNVVREGVLIYTWDGRLAETNQAALELLGYSRQQLLGRQTRFLAAPGRKQLPGLFRALRLALAGRPQQLEFWIRHGQGHSLPLQLKLVRGEFGGQPAIIALARDGRQQSPHFDPLTGLPNRNLLGERLRLEMGRIRKHGGRLAIAYLDLDGFKPINDELGHDIGDQVLRALGQRLQGLIGPRGSVARIGGDEFICLLPLKPGEQHGPRLELLLEAIASPCLELTPRLSLSGSLGVTFFPDDDESPDLLLRHADLAMYEAKRQGSNRIAYFDVAAARRENELQQTRRAIRLGLQQQQFRLFYQPKVDMRRGTVVGLEALIRWQHPERGLLPPAAFLPAAENDELIVSIGQWTLKTALAQIQSWWQQGLNLGVSVNLAARHLHHPEFMAHLQRLLADYPSLEPGQLELEILETTALENTGRAREIINSCARLGVGFSLDDFGTGYSSLAYLKTLPATTLKIDQCFIRDILHEPGEVAIVQGIISLARAFRQQVIAEGVETAECGALLLQLGCDQAQGYGIAHPMPADQVPGWLRSWRPPALWQQLADKRWAQEDHSLLAIGVEHRHWIKGILEYIGTGQPLGDDSLFDPGMTRLGRWYEGRGRALYGDSPEFANLEAPLRQIHVSVQEIAELLAREQPQAARQRVAALEAQRDQVLAALTRLQLRVAHPVQGSRLQ